MKKILCFGDSNTYGFNPNNSKRYEINERWSGILKISLKDFIIEEKGCNNRTCFNNQGELNSLEIINNYLNKDYAFAIIQLGINDLQFHYEVDLNVLEENLVNLIKKINQNTKVILLCPNSIKENILTSYFNCLFNENSIEKSKKLPEIYKKVANKTNSLLINLNDFAETSNIDGLHYDIENHNKIARKLIEILE